jgi:uncharacterized protein YrrD
MSARVASQKLIGNPVIDTTEGEMVAEVEDVLVDPETLKAVAVTTHKSTLLSPELKAIPADQVQVWGKDAVLVKQTDATVKEGELSSRKRWLSATDDIRGYEVVAEDGTRIGTLGDVALDRQGQIVGYEMAEVVVEGRVAVAEYVDVKATRSLGPDVLIVKSDYV